MAKRTAEADFAIHDMARSVERRFLLADQNSKEIYYEYDSPEPETLTSSDASLDSTPTSLSSAVSLPVPEGVQTRSRFASPFANVPDVPMTATEIAHVLVARKLRQGSEQVSVTRSIKELSGGWFPVRGKCLFLTSL